MRAYSTAADARLWKTSANAYFSQRRSDPLCLVLCVYVFRFFCCCLRFTLCTAFYFSSNVQLALFASATRVHTHVHCSCMCVCVCVYITSTIILIWWSQIIKSPSFNSHSLVRWRISSFLILLHLNFFFCCLSAVRHCACKDLCHFLMCALFSFLFNSAIHGTHRNHSKHFLLPILVVLWIFGKNNTLTLTNQTTLQKIAFFFSSKKAYGKKVHPKRREFMVILFSLQKNCGLDQLWAQFSSVWTFGCLSMNLLMLEHNAGNSISFSRYGWQSTRKRIVIFQRKSSCVLALVWFHRLSETVQCVQVLFFA